MVVSNSHPYPVAVGNPNGHGQLARRSDLKPSESPRLSIAGMWAVLLLRLKETTATIKERYDKRAIIEKEINARIDDWCIGIFQDTYTRIESLTAEFEMQLAITQNQEQGQSQALAAFTLSPWQMEERYRALVQMQSFLGSFFERASPSYDQAKTLWWFDPSYHLSDGLNYDRYGAPDVRALEARLLQALGLGNEKLPLKLLLTSSGVAAFTVLQQFLLSNVLQAGDVIVISPYLYFECFELVRQVNHIQFINSETFDAEDIIATAERHNAKAVYLDPMANTIGLETTDIRKFSQLISGREGWADRHLLIDGTLVSGGMAVFDWFSEPSHPKVLYYESAHKYIQMGMDIVMCGFLVYPEEYHDTLGLIRQVTGLTLYTRQANVLPQIDYDIHQSRMHHLTSNAEKLYHFLDKRASTIARFNYPLQWRKMGWSHGGNVVTIRLFGDDQINKRPSLDAFTSLVLRACEEEGVAMTKGGGLGFSVTRIWPSTPFIRNEDPYMRISVGVDPDEVEPVGRAIIKGLERHYHATRSVMAQWKLRENGIIKAPIGAPMEA
ncbi:pyridoxal phosphate-dependent transferase [Emericellopsis atlantica]|uniref:Pyridoxal phosphate-dependent transferase n=1 Tax=Emericellopsis atlantica TaxID=2614577 RepID=A0A9P7ZQY5_9HYPO|nr:pyridoxal phosphate-dependent transferase [Emericellopsis atlantica]KAG9256673.1 pyridoxal phosphate-dependent transferase [Emericellopsis atlantica]